MNSLEQSLIPLICVTMSPFPFRSHWMTKRQSEKEGHVGMAAAYASCLLLYEEGAFHRLEILQAFQADPDAVLVIRADSGHPFTLAVIADNHRVRHKMGCIGACLAPVYSSMCATTQG